MSFLRNLVTRIVTWVKYAVVAWQLGRQLLEMVRRLRSGGTRTEELQPA